MINETMLLRKLQRALGSELYNGFSSDEYKEILEEETLLTFSQYYPVLVKGITIREQDGIMSFNNQTGQQAMYKYKIPKENPSDEYTGIEWSYFAGNNNDGSTFSGLNPILTDALYQHVRSILPIPAIRFTARFEAPDFAIVDPIPTLHQDFVLTATRVRKLTEIPFNMAEYFYKLYIYDVKLYIYNQMKPFRESGTYNGIEVNTYISDFSDVENDRKDLLEVFEGDYYKDPARFETEFQSAP